MPRRDPEIPSQMISSRDLRARGWSQQMLRNMLGEPEITARGGTRYYEPERVNQLEADPGVAESLQANLLKQEQVRRFQEEGIRQHTERLTDEELEAAKAAHDKDNPAPDEPVISHAELMERGWSRGLIQDELGQPDYRAWRGGPY